MIEINFNSLDSEVLNNIIKGKEFNKYARSEFAILKNLPQTKIAEDIIEEFKEGLKNKVTPDGIVEFLLSFK